MSFAATSLAPIANKLLAALPRAEYRSMLSDLEPVMLSFGDVLYEPGEQIKHVYFPGDCLVSLLTLIDHHHALEVGLVGSEGMVGIAMALGISVSPVRALVQRSGAALRMKAASFRMAFRKRTTLQRGLHAYIHALMAEVAQTAACNRFHVVEARLARRLLMTRDRAGTDHFRLTHEFLAHILGVRRVGVTKAAHALKEGKLIDYSRGEISIINGRGLEAASCSCYGMFKDGQGKA